MVKHLFKLNLAVLQPCSSAPDPSLGDEGLPLIQGVQQVLPFIHHGQGILKSQ
jgi:hypothetical protein